MYIYIYIYIHIYIYIYIYTCNTLWRVAEGGATHSTSSIYVWKHYSCINRFAYVSTFLVLLIVLKLNSQPHTSLHYKKQKQTLQTTKHMSKQLCTTWMRPKQFQEHQTTVSIERCSPLHKMLIRLWKFNIDGNIITLFDVKHIQNHYSAEARFFYV